jgi:hypothetical protein
MKYEPTLPKSSPQVKQVWKEKVTPSPSQEVQSFGSPSLRLDDAIEGLSPAKSYLEDLKI